jgi:hypothetical protein
MLFHYRSGYAFRFTVINFTISASLKLFSVQYITRVSLLNSSILIPRLLAMTPPSVAIMKPLATTPGKKRSFRPRKKLALAVEDSLSAQHKKIQEKALPVQQLVPNALIENAAQTEPPEETPLAPLPEAIDAASLPVNYVAPLATGDAMLKTPRKRKTTGVAVGASRIRVTDQLQQQQQQQLEPEKTPPQQHQVETLADIPEDTSGQPNLSTYCSRFKSKRKPKNTTSETATTIQAPVLDNTVNSQVQPQPPSGPIVQVINGEIVLQASSLVVAGTSNATSTNDYNTIVVEEEAQLAVVGASYNSFVARRAPQHWSVDETRLFYEALRQVGTDFGTMEAYFDTRRTRKQLKRKYQCESAKNPALIEKALTPSAMKEIGRLHCGRVRSLFVLDSDVLAHTYLDMSVFNVAEENVTKVTTTTETDELPTEDAPLSDADLTLPAANADTTERNERAEQPTLAQQQFTLASPVADPLFWHEDVEDEIPDAPLLHEDEHEDLPVSVKTTKVAKKPKFRTRKMLGNK